MISCRAGFPLEVGSSPTVVPYQSHSVTGSEPPVTLSPGLPRTLDIGPSTSGAPGNRVYLLSYIACTLTLSAWPPSDMAIGSSPTFCSYLSAIQPGLKSLSGRIASPGSGLPKGRKGNHCSHWKFLQVILIIVQIPQVSSPPKTPPLTSYGVHHTPPHYIWWGRVSPLGEPLVAIECVTIVSPFLDTMRMCSHYWQIIISVFSLKPYLTGISMHISLSKTS